MSKPIDIIELRRQIKEGIFNVYLLEIEFISKMQIVENQC